MRLQRCRHVEHRQTGRRWLRLEEIAIAPSQDWSRCQLRNGGNRYCRRRREFQGWGRCARVAAPQSLGRPDELRLLPDERRVSRVEPSRIGPADLEAPIRLPTADELDVVVGLRQTGLEVVGLPQAV
eukprot:COSAG04_NODE_5118_length_1730_cov_1.179031_2_plen_127_part_00